MAFTELGSPTRLFDVPPERNRYFTGREDLLRQVREGLLSDRIKAISQVQAINGLGGVGKTQTAIEYCYRHFYDHQDYDYVFWIRSETEQELKSDLVKVARRISVKFDERDPDTALPGVLDWFEKRDRWLLVFDNADEPDLLTHYVPRQKEGSGHVLVTSRARRFASLGTTRPLKMPVMPDEEGVRFLRKRLEIPEDDEGHLPCTDDRFRQLVRELGGLPLALEQAAAYMFELEYGPEDYLKLYRKQGLALLEKALPQAGDYHRDKDVPPSVATTWLLNFEQVQQESPAAADLLTASSFFAPDEIPLRLIVEGGGYLGPLLASTLSDGADPEQVVRELVAVLTRFSLVAFDPGGESYSVHRLVQRVAQEPLGDFGRSIWLECCVHCLNEAWPSVDFESWDWCEKVLPHTLQLFEHLSRNGKIVASAGRVFNNAAYYLKDRGQFSTAELLLQEALTIAGEAMGKRHPNYSSALDNLGVLYAEQGKLAEAEPLCTQALAITRENSDERSPNYAYRLCNLARIYRERGRLAEAESFYLEALAIGRETIGEQHPDYATWLNHLSELYRQQWRLAEAEPVCQQALVITRVAKGEQHPDYAVRLCNLANIHLQQRKLTQAQPLYEQALAITREAYGERHPQCATALNNIAVLYTAQGRLAEAEPLCREALALTRDAHGERHPHRAIWLCSLANIYLQQGKLAEAEPLYEQALAITRETYGERHASCATYVNNLAELFRRQGRFADAESLYGQALAITQEAEGERNFNYATWLNNLAELYLENGKLSEAESFRQQAVSITREAVGERHPDYAMRLCNLAYLHLQQGRLAEAERLYEQTLGIFAEVLGAQHPHCQTVRERLASLRKDDAGGCL